MGPSGGSWKVFWWASLVVGVFPKQSTLTGLVKISTGAGCRAVVGLFPDDILEVLGEMTLKKLVVGGSRRKRPLSNH